MADSIDDIGFDSCETNPTPDPLECPDASPVTQCPDDVWQVEIVNQAPQIDNEYICDTDTNTWQLVIFIDGVQDSSTDTGISCDDQPPADYEPASECRNDTLWTVFYQVAADGTVTELSAIDTGIECNPDVIIGNTCDNPIPIATCPDNPLEVTIVDQRIDVEFVCNADTGVFDKIVVTSLNGVETGETVTATTISCDTEVFDYEQPVVCRDGERTLLLNQIAEDGTVTELTATPLGEPCPQAQVDCVESQEWTYGIDNTGTNFSYADATYEITLSDGSTLQWSQTAQADWTPQLQEWAAGIQAAADAAGLAWFVEPRAVNNPNPTDISGNYGNNPTGLPGAPSVPIAVALIDGGMAARYVNIQICPGQPVPVAANVVTVADQGTAPSAAADGFALNTAGAVLGPLQKFFVCRTCGVEPVWYLDDGVTEAEPGQIPNCFEPCGTLALTDAPPDRECDFFFDLGCDNVGQNDPNNFVQQITRRATVCNGEQISLDYFTEDPNDPTALVDYTLDGDFVDCDSGEPVEAPEPECSEFVLTDLFRVDPSTSTGALVANDYQLDAEGHDPVSLENSVADVAAWPVGADGVPDPSTVGVLNATSPQAWATLNTNDVENTAGVDNADVQVIAGFVAVESDLMFRYSGVPEGYTAVYLDACCAGAKTLIYERSQNIGGPGEQGDASGVLPSGIHAISIINYDANGTNSAANFQHSIDGGVSWSNGFPGVSLSAVKPKQECLKVKVCVDTGALIDLLSGEVLDSADLSACPIECGVDPNTALLEEIRDLLGGDGECPCTDEAISAGFVVQ